VLLYISQHQVKARRFPHGCLAYYEALEVLYKAYAESHGYSPQSDGRPGYTELDTLWGWIFSLNLPGIDNEKNRSPHRLG